MMMDADIPAALRSGYAGLRRPEHRSMFDFYKIVDAQLDFERNAGGKIIAVVLHQNGRDMRAPRMPGQR